jgi:hypothetical protein
VKSSAMRFLAALLCALCLLASAPAWAAMPQPGDACSRADDNMTVQGQAGTLYGHHMVCSSGVWTVAAFQVGQDASDTCNGTLTAALRWDASSTRMQFCNGSSWLTLASSTVTYAGNTPGAYSGAAGGITGAGGTNAKCNAAFSGSRMARTSDLPLLGTTEIVSGWVYDDSAMHADTVFSGGCLGFSSTSAFGTYINSNSPVAISCTITAPIVCVYN